MEEKKKFLRKERIKDFAEKLKPMPAFRNRLIHDYLPNRFEAERLYDALGRLDDFRQFMCYIIDWLEAS